MTKGNDFLSESQYVWSFFSSVKALKISPLVLPPAPRFLIASCPWQNLMKLSSEAHCASNSASPLSMEGSASLSLRCSFVSHLVWALSTKLLKIAAVTMAVGKSNRC